MTDRAEIVAKITAIVVELTGIPADALVNDKPLDGQGEIDSLDVVEIVMAVEDHFLVPYDIIGATADVTIDAMADAVMKVTTA